MRPPTVTLSIKCTFSRPQSAPILYCLLLGRPNSMLLSWHLMGKLGREAHSPYLVPSVATRRPALLAKNFSYQSCFPLLALPVKANRLDPRFCIFEGSAGDTSLLLIWKCWHFLREKWSSCSATNCCILGAIEASRNALLGPAAPGSLECRAQWILYFHSKLGCSPIPSEKDRIGFFRDYLPLKNEII